MENKTISHFRILKLLGEGGMGRIFLAEDTVLNRKTVLKFLPAQYTSNPFLKARFKREAQAAAALKHPNIITVYELVECPQGFYIAMEYVDGKPLSEWIEDREISILRVLDIAMQLCRGLRRAHNAGIVHRDIKPANIMVDRDGWVKILDFGLAKIRDVTRLTEQGMRIGTISYMSPEQIRGKDLDHRSDIYSLGVVIYQLLARRLPFEGDSDEEVNFAILHKKPEPLARYKAGITDGLQRLIDKALDKDLETRYQHVDDLLSDLKREKRIYENAQKSTLSLHQTPPSSRPPARKSPARKPRRGRAKPRLDFGFALLAVVLPTLASLVLGLWLFSATNQEESRSLRDSLVAMRDALQGTFSRAPSTPRNDPRPPQDRADGTSRQPPVRMAFGLSPVLQELAHLSKTRHLLRSLNLYSQLMLISVGNRADFKDLQNCYVFVVDRVHVLGCYRFRANAFHALFSEERYRDLSLRYPGKTAIWVQDHTISNRIDNFARLHASTDLGTVSLKDSQGTRRYLNDDYLLVVYDLRDRKKPRVLARGWPPQDRAREAMNLDSFARLMSPTMSLPKNDFSTKF